jgi:hypothetical protein
MLQQNSMMRSTAAARRGIGGAAAVGAAALPMRDQSRSRQVVNAAAMPFSAHGAFAAASRARGIAAAAAAGSDTNGGARTATVAAVRVSFCFEKGAGGLL